MLGILICRVSYNKRVDKRMDKKANKKNNRIDNYNSHKIVIVDLRPIKGKNVKMCRICGLDGKSLYKHKCIR